MIQILPFDAQTATSSEWEAVHAFRRARNEEDTPGEPIPDDAEFERELRQRWPLYDNRRWYVWDGAGIVGVVGTAFRRPETVDFKSHAPYAYAWGGVREHRRRQGIGTDLLRPLLGFMRQNAKEIATFDTSTPSGEAFLTALGATLKHTAIENRAAFDQLDWDMLARWKDSTAQTYPTLRWEVHASRVPRDRIETLMPQLNALLRDVPQGDLDGPPLRLELAAWLAWYEEVDRHDGDHVLVLLKDGEELAAVCEMEWDARTPDRIFQKLTAVSRPCRGHGLAKGVKAAMLRLVRERRPEVRCIMTWNAVANAPMLSINRRLGFVEHRRTASYQIGIETLAAVVGDF
jgi:GNAT superfamily N-acetyltransferase